MAENGNHSAMTTTTSLFESGTGVQWKYVLSKYRSVLKLKADGKTKGGKELLKLDSWYQEELPDIIKKRKDKHLTYDEIVNVMRWKLLRGKFRPRLTDLVKTNTPLAVFNATKRGFKRMPKLSHAIAAVATLKGVGPAMASAVLTAGLPEHMAFMADEAMLATPGVTSIDYTVEEYMRFATNIQKCVDRLNKSDADGSWTPHKVELTLWTYYNALKLQPSILDDMPAADDVDSINGKSSVDDSLADDESNGSVKTNEESSDDVVKVNEESSDDVVKVNEESSDSFKKNEEMSDEITRVDDRSSDSNINEESCDSVTIIDEESKDGTIEANKDSSDEPLDKDNDDSKFALASEDDPGEKKRILEVSDDPPAKKLKEIPE